MEQHKNISKDVGKEWENIGWEQSTLKERQASFGQYLFALVSLSHLVVYFINKIRQPWKIREKI
jgi:hypothetical protein